MDKGAALAGGLATYTYFGKLQWSYAMRNYANGFGAFMVDPGTGSPPSGLWITRFSGATATPTISRTRLDVQNFGTFQPSPRQPGSSLPVLRGPPIADAILAGDVAHVLVTDQINNYAALRMFRIRGMNTPDLTQTLQGSTLFTVNGNHVFDGSLVHDGLGGSFGGSVWIGANCSGTGLYISACLDRIAGGCQSRIARNDHRQVRHRDP